MNKFTLTMESKSIPAFAIISMEEYEDLKNKVKKFNEQMESNQALCSSFLKFLGQEKYDVFMDLIRHKKI